MVKLLISVSVSVTFRFISGNQPVCMEHVLEDIMNCPHCATASQTAGTPCTNCGTLVVSMSQKVIIPAPPPLVYQVQQPSSGQPTQQVVAQPTGIRWWHLVTMITGVLCLVVTIGFWIHWGQVGTTTNQLANAATLVNGNTDGKVAAATTVINANTDAKVASATTAINGNTDAQVSAGATVINANTDAKVASATTAINGNTDAKVAAATVAINDTVVSDGDATRARIASARREQRKAYDDLVMKISAKHTITVRIAK